MTACLASAGWLASFGDLLSVTSVIWRCEGPNVPDMPQAEEAGNAGGGEDRASPILRGRIHRR